MVEKAAEVGKAAPVWNASTDEVLVRTMIEFVDREWSRSRVTLARKSIPWTKILPVMAERLDRPLRYAMLSSRFQYLNQRYTSIRSALNLPGFSWHEPEACVKASEADWDAAVLTNPWLCSLRRCRFPLYKLVARILDWDANRHHDLTNYIVPTPSPVIPKPAKPAPKPAKPDPEQNPFICGRKVAVKAITTESLAATKPGNVPDCVQLLVADVIAPPPDQDRRRLLLAAAIHRPLHTNPPLPNPIASLGNPSNLLPVDPIKNPLLNLIPNSDDSDRKECWVEAALSPSPHCLHRTIPVPIASNPVPLHRASACPCCIEARSPNTDPPPIQETPAKQRRRWATTTSSELQHDSDRLLVELLKKHYGDGHVQGRLKRKTWRLIEADWRETEKECSTIFLQTRFYDLRNKYHEIADLIRSEGFCWDQQRSVLIASDSVWREAIDTAPSSRSRQARRALYAQRSENGHVAFPFFQPFSEMKDIFEDRNDQGGDAKQEIVDGSATPARKRKRREDGEKNRPRYPRTRWTPEMDADLVARIVSGCESGAAGAAAFTSAAWDQVIDHYRETYGPSISESILKARYYLLRSRFVALAKMRADDRVQIDPSTWRVNAPNPVWQSLKKTDLWISIRAFQKRPFPAYPHLAAILGDGKMDEVPPSAQSSQKSHSASNSASEVSSDEESLPIIAEERQ